MPTWLDTLARPVVVLVDSPEAEPPRLSLHAGPTTAGPAEGRLLQALEAVLPADPRLPRLRRAWTAQQQQSLQAGVNFTFAWAKSLPATNRWPKKACWRVAPKRKRHATP